MPNSKRAVSIIIPCYNEERNLEQGALNQVYQYLIRQDYAWQVIVVNDESTDHSASLVKQFIADKERFILFDIPHSGKPAAIWAGIQQASGEVVLFADMDQSTPMAELGKLLPWCDQGFDMVIGSRGSTRQGFSLMRKAGSFVFRTVRGLFLLRDIADTQCGFKLCRRQVALEVFPRLEFFRNKARPTGWKVTAYDVELLFLVEQSGYRIKEVEVNWSNRDQSDTKSQSSEWVRYLNESIDMAKQVMRVKLNQLKGLYDKV